MSLEDRLGRLDGGRERSGLRGLGDTSGVVEREAMLAAGALDRLAPAAFGWL
jgi:hypothetical protein